MAITDQYRCLDPWSTVPAGAPATSGLVADGSGGLAPASANRPMITRRRAQAAAKANKTGATRPPLIPPERSSP